MEQYIGIYYKMGKTKRYGGKNRRNKSLKKRRGGTWFWEKMFGPPKPEPTTGVPVVPVVQGAPVVQENTESTENTKSTTGGKRNKRKSHKKRQ